MLGRLMNEWQTPALQRVSDATLWMTGDWGSLGAERCLVGHATGVHEFVLKSSAGMAGLTLHENVGPMYGPGSSRWILRNQARLTRPAWTQFDKLCRRFGRDRIVRLIQDRTRRILAAREIAAMPQLELAREALCPTAP